MSIARWKIRTIQGSENLPVHGGFIVVANHPSWLDPLYLGASLFFASHRPIVFLSSSKRHTWTRSIIYVDPRQPHAALEEAAQHIASGDVVGFFPFARHVLVNGKPKTGAVRLAESTGAPVIPAIIEGTVHGHVIRSLWQFFRPGKSVTVKFGSPVAIPHGLNDADHERVIENLKNRLVQMRTQ